MPCSHLHNVPKGSVCVLLSVMNLMISSNSFWYVVCLTWHWLNAIGCDRLRNALFEICLETFDSTVLFVQKLCLYVRKKLKIVWSIWVSITIPVPVPDHRFTLLPVAVNYRTGYTVHVPVPEHMFTLMPREIQRGHPIRIIPVMFTIGINEQSTFAER